MYILHKLARKKRNMIRDGKMFIKDKT